MTGTSGPATAADVLDAAFAETVRGIGASIGALYLLTPDEELLRLHLLCGAPAEFAVPWARVPVAAPAPVAVAAREGRLVWVGSQEEMARSFPRTAMVLPYPLALAAAPVIGARRWGTLLLMWPTGRPPYMTARERGHIESRCRRLALLLDEAEEQDGAPAPAALPHVVPADTRDLDVLIGELVEKAGPAGRRTDDIALLLLHYEGHHEGHRGRHHGSGA
ncbi:hypothetical protein [Streptomyces heilongjiangensis]|uniref:GAF domain-containing protein n=1 Tax=Streptomyces heilongjiangensis TaxID=945052 RepID=A0ABW1B648_9ACTN|nr:hypothetical protein [Streptomyces heilongjiangensis]MDC2947572.1 hypothetical protein [Streptomyces heilongjiangensis]